MTTKADKAYWDRLAREVGCIACKIEGITNHHVSIHHISGRTRPGAHRQVLPLCANHHQTGGEGMAIHPFKRQWEMRYGKQADLKKKCDAILAGKK